ncbi:protein kinase domain-containing protein [Streptomyces sp. NBC_01794]|uniref:protein kinase domain-containing protein n=1 Tax=Streptomyces sp. NBC_01794 TaxID=2975942 RepID=UPI003090B3A6|nr:serine/threonine-protein kinase [Streptomyces sp. NBC_01794]
MYPLGTGDPLRLGPYRLLGVLGEGGMGKVYFGQDSAGGTAAVKVLRPELAHDQHLAQRFVREAQMAQAVASKGIARVLGSQMEGGRPWIATEFLAGPTLDEAIRSYGPMDDPTVRALASTLANTLHDIHAAGLVHRDLKPPNIVLTSAGPRIIDFGIARPEHGLTLTTTGQVPVTPGYGAPEQILGQRVGPPADVFSLGAVLTFASSGRRAFDAGHVAAVQYEVVHGEPDLAQVSLALQPLIGPCLAKDTGLRPAPGQIASAFAPPRGAERAWRQGRLANDIKARETGVQQLTTQPGSDTSTTVSRRRLLTTLAAGGTVLAAGGGGAVWWLRRGDESSGSGTESKAASGPFDIPPAVETPKARILDRKQAATTKTGELKLAPLWGPLAVNAGDSPPPMAVRDVIVFGARNGGLAAHSVVDGKMRWSAPEIDTAGGYISLSDRLIAAVGLGGKLVTFVASTGERKWTAPAAARCVLAADEDSVYVVTTDGQVRAIGRSDAKVRWTADSPADVLKEARPSAVAAQGRLIFGAKGGVVVALDASNGGKAWTFPSGAETVNTPAVHGSTVFLGGKNLTARRISNGNEIWTNKPYEDYTGELLLWSTPTVNGDRVYAMRGSWAQSVSLTDGNTVWDSTTPPKGDSRSAVQVQSSFAWIMDYPWVVGMELDHGEAVARYEPSKASPTLGFTAHGNRVFVMTEESLTALPVF